MSGPQAYPAAARTADADADADTDAGEAISAEGAEGVDEQVALDLHDLPSGPRGAIEAVLMVIDQPVPEIELAAALQLPVDEVVAHLTALAQDYANGGRGFTLRDIAGGWRIYSSPEYARVVERFLTDGRRAKLSAAALETLAVVAYRQPVSRSRIGAVRGVNVDGVVRTLLSHGLIDEAGIDESSGATLYGTTGYFLARLGLSSLDDLPALAPFLPEADLLDDLADLAEQTGRARQGRA
jgi:segregation and condensation protein B